jgi:integrase/recombinase XerC/integrase/recombinase XerD
MTPRDGNQVIRRRARLSGVVYVPTPKARPQSLPVTSLRGHLSDWIRSCRASQLSPRTIADREWSIEKLIWWCECEGKIEQLDRTALENYLIYIGTPASPEKPRWGHAHERNNGAVRPVYVKNHYRVLRTWFNWLVDQERIETSPLAKVTPPIARPDQIKPFTDDQIRALLVAAKASRFPRRDVAVICLLLDTGIRADELCQLTVGCVDMSARSLTIEHGKGDKQRVVYYGKRCAQALADYLRADDRQDSDPLIVSERGEHFTPSGLLGLINRLGASGGLSGVRCSPHTFRHTFAINFLNSGGQEFGLMTALGHTSTTMTRRYCDMSRANLAQMMAVNSPADAILGPGRGRRKK